MSKTKLTPNQIDVLALTSDPVMSDSFVNLAGDTMTGDLHFGDNDHAYFGTGDDLRLYHSAGISYISNTTGSTIINTAFAGSTITISGQAGTKLGYAGVTKIETTAAGVDFSGDISLPDNDHLYLGTGDDLDIYHSGAATVVTYDAAATGQSLLFNYGAGSSRLVLSSTSVRLYESNILKMSTATDGIDMYGHLHLRDNDHLYVGTDNDLDVFHTGSAGTIRNNTGDLTIRANSGDYLVIDRYFITNRKFARFGGANHNVEIYYDDSLKLETLTTGVAITGVATGDTAPTADSHLTRKDYVDSEISAASAAAGNMTVDSFVDGVDYNVGSPFNDTELTLSVSPGSENNIWVFFDGVEQHHTEFSISGSPATITFTEAIPLDVADIEVMSGTTLPIGTPADGTVTEAKLSSELADSLVYHPEITYISKSGHNSFFALIDGKLYSTHGTNANNNTGTSGRGINGQCGWYGLDSLKLIQIPTHSPIKKVVGGARGFAACLLENGDLYVWGSNENGQLGLGITTDVGFPTLSTTSVTDVYDHVSNVEYANTATKMVILKSDGFLYTTGENANGNLGVGDTTDRSSWTKVLNITSGTVKSVWNLGAHKGALVVQLNDNTVWVCGYNLQGSLGNATTTNQTQLIDVTTAWLPDTTYEVKSIASSGSYWTGSAETTYSTMGMLSDNGTNQTVRMSGRNAQGQLGDTTLVDKSTPITPTGIPTTGLVDFAGLGCILISKLLTSTGDLWSWGYNAHGAVGDGTTTNRSTPAVVETTVTSVFNPGIGAHTSGHYAQHWILKDDGIFYATGYNASSYLGDGTTTTATSYTKVILELPSGEIPVDMGAFTTNGGNRVLVLLTNYNNMYTWGYNGNFGVRDGNSNLNVRVPVQVNLPNIR